MSELLLPILPTLRRTIRTLEALRKFDEPSLSLEGDGELLAIGRAALLSKELIKLWDSPERAGLEALALLVWEAAVTREEPTVWLLRSYSPEASLTLLLCAVSNVSLGRLLEGDLSESQSFRITSALESLAKSSISISETPEDGSLGERLNLARWLHGAENGVCDWVLSPDERRAVQKSRLQVFAAGDPLEASE